MSLGDSILQTASMARWVSEDVTAFDYSTVVPPVQAEAGCVFRFHEFRRGIGVDLRAERP